MHLYVRPLEHQRLFMFVVHVVQLTRSRLRLRFIHGIQMLWHTRWDFLRHPCPPLVNALNMKRELSAFRDRVTGIVRPHLLTQNQRIPLVNSPHSSSRWLRQIKVNWTNNRLILILISMRWKRCWSIKHRTRSALATVTSTASKAKRRAISPHRTIRLDACLCLMYIDRFASKTVCVCVFVRMSRKKEKRRILFLFFVLHGVYICFFFFLSASIVSFTHLLGKKMHTTTRGEQKKSH